MEKDYCLINSGVKKRKSYEVLCRCRDILFSFLAIIVFFVPALILMLIIVIDSPGASPIYIQRRVGKDGKEFSMIKFRSMRPFAEAQLEQLKDKNEMSGPAFKIKDDPRITRIGKIIRKTGIDELPQFLNVLCGQMSVIGPRPPLPREVEQYNEYEKQRLSVLPGITCLWQISPHRNTVDFKKWVELDLQYIQERCVALDIKIILLTFVAAFKGYGE